MHVFMVLVRSAKCSCITVTWISTIDCDVSRTVHAIIILRKKCGDGQCGLNWQLCLSTTFKFNYVLSICES